MISFVVAQSIRFYRELSVRPFTQHISKAAAWILGYVSLQMIAFFNSQLIFAEGYPQLFVKYAKFLLTHALDGFLHFQPAPILAMLCLGMSLPMAPPHPPIPLTLHYDDVAGMSVYWVMMALLDANQDGTFTAEDLKIIGRELRDKFSLSKAKAVR